MKAVATKGPREFQDIELEEPKAGGKWVTLRVKACAICGSDRSFWDGIYGPGFVPGHEFAGYIEDGGEYGFKKGTKVVAAEFNSCGECEFCKEGKEELCLQMMADNPGVSAVGAYGEVVRVRGDYVIEMPEDMPFELGAITEPMAVSLHGVKQLDLRKGEDILISGNGPIGIYAALAAKLLGAGRVVMTGRSQSRVDFCSTLPFVDVCLSVKDPEYADKLKANTPAGGFRSIVDCVGVDDYDELASYAKNGATIVALGMHAQRASFSTMAFYLKELKFKTGLYFTWNEYKEAFAMIRDNQELFLKTITSKIPATAEEVQNAFMKLFASGNNTDCKIIMEH